MMIFFMVIGFKKNSGGHTPNRLCVSSRTVHVARYGSFGEG